MAPAAPPALIVRSVWPSTVSQHLRRRYQQQHHPQNHSRSRGETFAGLAGSTGSANGTGSTARFNSPGALAVDSGNNIYVADTNNSTIRKITPARVASTFAGLAGSIGTANGTGSAARFNFPDGVAVDRAGTGNIYVGDTGNFTIRKITPARVVTTLADRPS